MVRRPTLIGVLLMVVLLTALPTLGVAAPEPSRPAQTGGELLTNPGFEGLTCPGLVPPDACPNGRNFTHRVHIQDGILRDNIETPEGWVTWWREAPPEWTQPEVVLMPRSNPTYSDPNLPRIRSGSYASKIFGPAGKVDGGLYQVVTGLRPGATVQLTAYAHTWSCDSMQGNRGPATTCGDPNGMWVQLGIEPNGLADPFSPSVIWSQNYYVPDYYQAVGPLRARVGANGAVVVILRSTAKWPVPHNDAYWDDVSLTYVGPVVQPTNTPLPPPTVDPYAPTRTPLPTFTPRPDGAIVHVVQPGDTLFSIALKYGVDMEQIRRLNVGSIGPNNLIVVGQELVIAVPAAVQPTVAPTELSVPEAPAAAEATVTPAAVSAVSTAICVLAFHDRNGDTFRNDPVTEELLPSTEFAVADARGVIARYTTDGVSEPYCFVVPPGAYRVIQTSPSGYTASGQAERNVALSEGASLSLQFGNVRSKEAEAVPQPTEEAALGAQNPGTSGSSPAESILKTVAKVGGALALVLAVALAVLFVINRQRM